MPGRTAELGQLPLAGDMQSLTKMAPNVNLLNREGLFVADDPSQQTSASQYAAVSTSTIACVALMPAADGTARDPRKREEPNRQVHFHSASHLPEENRFRAGTQEYRNAREQRLRVFASREPNEDSDG